MHNAMASPQSAPVLDRLGAAVRQLRSERGWSRRELATRSGLSERFLAQIEAGGGNPSVLTLDAIARACGVGPATLLGPGPGPVLVALLGLRGAGKSTIGRALAKRAGIPFVELDERIEEATGLSLREIFEIHGEGAYRAWEREALEGLVARAERLIVATGGGIVTHPENFDILRRHALTIWLKASPEEHWSRVVAQGDHRPMANDPLAMAHLRELLARREELYRTADHTIVTSGASVDQIVARAAAIVAA